MAKGSAIKFYNSVAWKKCRNEYVKQAHYLCENCLANGIYKPGEIVHHVRPLTPETLECPEVALNFDNLRLLCRECHAAEHNDRLKQRRYIVEPNGRLVAIER